MVTFRIIAAPPVRIVLATYGKKQSPLQPEAAFAIMLEVVCATIARLDKLIIGR
jgi:hypothetical protein